MPWPIYLNFSGNDTILVYNQMMNEMNNRELQVALNKVCFSSDFKS